MAPKSVNAMQKEVERGQAPKSIDRVDGESPPRDRYDHIHFKDDGHGKHALYCNGEWKHGGRPLTRDEKKWITECGWVLPN